jgi:GTP-binding protein
MFKDTVEITITSGNGGVGSTQKYGGKPIGGDGGDGGNIVLKGSTKIFDLSKLSPSKPYIAKDGKPGSTTRRQGTKGEDLIIEVPFGTEVFENDELLLTLNRDLQEEIVLEGGKGSLGSTSLSGNSYKALEYEHIVAGKNKTLKLIMKLTCDVLFFGLPNAGKSSMLNVLAHTAVKTASYSFTTLSPQTGIMDGLILMDLPGLIEGTAEGKGVGDDFIKHTEKANLIVHFVSLEEVDPIESYKQIRKEILTLPRHIRNMREVVVLTKYDSVDDKKRDEVLDKLKAFNQEIVYSSIIDDESLEKVKDLILKNFVKKDNTL